MKLVTRFQASVFMVLFAIFITSVLIAAIYYRQQKTTRIVMDLTSFNEDVFKLNLLTHDLILYDDTTRPVQQWRQLFEKLSNQSPVLEGDLEGKDDLEKTKPVLLSLQQLFSTYEQILNSRRSLEAKGLYKELRDHITSQLMARSQTLYSTISNVHKNVIIQYNQIEKSTQFTVGIILYLLLGFILVNVFRLERHVMQSLNYLGNGAREITGGNLDFRFQCKDKDKDEITALTKMIDGMVQNLEEALAAEQIAKEDHEQAEKEIKAKNTELETLLYVISHDLKEPLRAIEYFSTAVCERHAASLDPEAKDYLSRSAQGAVRMRRLLDDILNLARARRGTVPAKLIPAREIIKGALERLEHKIKETGARVEVTGDFQDLRVDPTWGKEAVYNLISNALTYVKSGESPQIEIVPYRSVKGGPKEAGVIVQDHGPGIAPELAERIFLLFQRGVGRQIEGTGAGLAIVKAVAEQHGGRAWTEPREGGGSKFIIAFKC